MVDDERVLMEIGNTNHHESATAATRPRRSSRVTTQQSNRTISNAALRDSLPSDVSDHDELGINFNRERHVELDKENVGKKDPPLELDKLLLKSFFEKYVADKIPSRRDRRKLSKVELLGKSKERYNKLISVLAHTCCRVIAEFVGSSYDDVVFGTSKQMVEHEMFSSMKAEVDGSEKKLIDVIADCITSSPLTYIQARTLRSVAVKGIDEATLKSNYGHLKLHQHGKTRVKAYKDFKEMIAGKSLEKRIITRLPCINLN